MDCVAVGAASGAVGVGLGAAGAGSDAGGVGFCPVSGVEDVATGESLLSGVAQFSAPAPPSHLFVEQELPSATADKQPNSNVQRARDDLRGIVEGRRLCI